MVAVLAPLTFGLAVVCGMLLVWKRPRVAAGLVLAVVIAHAQFGMALPAPVQEVATRVVAPVRGLHDHQEQAGRDFGCAAVTTTAVREGSERAFADARDRCPEAQVHTVGRGGQDYAEQKSAHKQGLQSFSFR